MEFEWDERKAAANRKKHGVSFHEAATVFGDPLAITFSDPDHSETEQRSVTFGVFRSNHLIVVAHTDRGRKVRTSVPGWSRGVKGKFMRKAKRDELRPEYRREDLGNGTRRKYAKAYRVGTNLVLLKPEVAAAFPTERVVNDARSSLIEVAQQTIGSAKRPRRRLKTARG
ncbi:MAG: BrnT family toxin [Nitrospirota bacterium]